MDIATKEQELIERTKRFIKAELKRADVTYEELAERLLQEALTASGLPTGVVTVEEFRDMLRGMAEHSEKLPNLATESFSRESFYEDRLNGRDSVPRR